MSNFQNLHAGQIINMRKLAEEALGNWDTAEMSAGEIAYLEHQVKFGDEEYEISATTARSFRDEWDMLAEYAASSAA